MVGIILSSDNKIKRLFKEEYFKDFFVHKINNRKFYIVTSMVGEMFAITFCGLGKTNAASCATHIINNFKVTNIINAGIAYYFNQSLNNTNIVLVNETQYSDYYLKEQNDIFITNTKMNNIIQKIISSSSLTFQLGDCYTSDNINSQEIVTKSHVPIIYDTECAAIGHVCNLYNIHFSSFKVLCESSVFKNITNKENKTTLAYISSTLDMLIYNIVQEISHSDLKDIKEAKNI